MFEWGIPIMKDISVWKNIERELTLLKHFVWAEDIPHPTTPPTRETHEKIQRILGRIDRFNDLITSYMKKEYDVLCDIYYCAHYVFGICLFLNSSDESIVYNTLLENCLGFHANEEY